MPAIGAAAEYPDPTLWESTVAAFALEDEVANRPQGAIVATGSSSIRLWDHRIRQDLAPLSVISRGFGGSNMNDLRHYLRELVLKHAPRAVMIYEGDNDVAQGVPVRRILSTYRGVIERIHQADANIRIYLLSVKPSLARASMWPVMRDVNTGMNALARESDNVFFIDVATPMLKTDGSVRDDLFVSDQLHMNQRGYDLWRNAVAPVLIANEIRYEPAPERR